MTHYPAIYLASASPRRQELLRQLGIAFDVVVTHVPEAPSIGDTARAYGQRLARTKAEAGARLARERG